MRLWQAWTWLPALAFGALLQAVLAEFHPKITISKNDYPSKDYGYFDDLANIIALRNEKLEMSLDDGVSWKQVDATKNSRIIFYQFDYVAKNRAFAFTTSKEQYVTNDKGVSWTKFVISNGELLPIDSFPRVVTSQENDQVALLDFYSCPEHESFSSNCKHHHYLTTDGFKTDPKPLNVDANICIFAPKNSDKGTKKDAIYCSKDKFNLFGHVVESKLLVSDDYFKSQMEVEHNMAKTGKIIDVRYEKAFLIVIVQSDKFNAKLKVSMLVSTDGSTFDTADLKIDVSYGVMTFLESEQLAIYLSVMDYSNRFEEFTFSTLYSSDATGLKFTKRLEKIQGGAIQKVQNIQGVWLGNVANELESDDGEKSLLDLLIGGGYSKDIQTKVSINSGKDWSPLRVNNDPSCKSKDCSLHLLTPAERDGEGKFVTGPTPGIVMGVGSKGLSLDRDINNMNTWISRDGGSTWDFALKEPCLFSFGDQGNIIVAIPYYSKDQEKSNVLYHSVDQGKTWLETKLEDPIYPLTMTTTVDGTSTKFIVAGLSDSANGKLGDFSEVLYALDFSKAFDGKKCSKDRDFEKVYVRILPETDEPICVAGGKQNFYRRKQTAECFVSELFTDVKSDKELCDCTEDDFDCGPGFDLVDGKCTVNKNRIAALCKAKNTKTLSLPNRILPESNECTLKDTKLVTTEKFTCSEFTDGKNDDNKSGQKQEIVSTLNYFDGELAEYTYVDPSPEVAGENIVVRTHKNIVYISNNGGVDFSKVPIPDHVVAFYVGFVPGQVVLVTNSHTIYVSVDGGSTFRKEKAPTKTNSLGARAISFNRETPDEFIWYGDENCEDILSSNCQLVAYITRNAGRDFTKIKAGVKGCDFLASVFEDSSSVDKNLIYCTTGDSTGRYRLESSTTDFSSSSVVFDDIVGYAISGKFVVVAAVDEKQMSLKAKVTVNGVDFADADFPADFHVDRQQAYTVLDSESQAIFIHVTTNPDRDQEYGSLLKSNSNGTSYVLSLDKVNRNAVGYVDYDRIDGVEGVIISNTVNNPDSGSKKLKTQITHNDGGEWSFLAPPAVDSEGKKYACAGLPLAKCSLNLHGFTQRADYRDTFSSTSATGLLIGIGNVGETLDHYDKAATFISRDAGITWKEVKSGVYMWEYGDRGTILVLVHSRDPTDSISYSLDEGETWHDYQFAQEPIRVLDLATVPSDTSTKFLVLGHRHGDRGKTISYSIDFTNIYLRQCQIDLDNPDDDDFEYWSPKHPFVSDNCLFGHEAKYLRRAVGHDDCFIGSAPLKEGFKVLRNCSCTRKDFECDFNYYRDSDDTCKLVKGLSPSDRKNEMCKKEGSFEYFEPTGYRKIPLSTCVDGKQFDSWHPQACPGKQTEFDKHYGRDVGSGKFLLIVGIPIFVFLFATWFVYDRGVRRNGGFKRFGQIRLNEEDDFQPIENNDVDRVVNSIVRGGIYVAAFTIATFKTLRKVDKALLDRVASLVFRRRPGHRSYVQVPNIDEEEELFGNFQDNYDEELEESAEVANFRDQVDEEDLASFAEENTEVADSRLFNIEDQSDEENLKTTDV